MLNYLSNTFNHLLNYKGALFAFIIMYVVAENTTHKDVLLRLVIIALMTNEATEFVQWLFDFEAGTLIVFSQFLGVFSMWAGIGVLKCIFLPACRDNFVRQFVKIVSVTKWGK